MPENSSGDSYVVATGDKNSLRYYTVVQLPHGRISLVDPTGSESRLWRFYPGGNLKEDPSPFDTSNAFLMLLIK